MALRQILLTILFGIHWVVFAFLMIRKRQWSLALPLSVFTFLVLTQVLWASPVMVPMGPLGEVKIRIVLRVIAIVLAVPSLTMMGLRIRRRILSRKAGADLTPVPVETDQPS